MFGFGSEHETDMEAWRLCRLRRSYVYCRISLFPFGFDPWSVDRTGASVTLGVRLILSWLDRMRFIPWDIPYGISLVHLYPTRNPMTTPMGYDVKHPMERHGIVWIFPWTFPWEFFPWELFRIFGASRATLRRTSHGKSHGNSWEI